MMELTTEERTQLELMQALQRAVQAELRIKELEFRNRLSSRTGIPADAIGIDPMGRITDSRIAATDREVSGPIDAPADEATSNEAHPGKRAA